MTDRKYKFIIGTAIFGTVFAVLSLIFMVVNEQLGNPIIPEDEEWMYLIFVFGPFIPIIYFSSRFSNQMFEKSIMTKGLKYKALGLNTVYRELEYEDLEKLLKDKGFKMIRKGTYVKEKTTFLMVHIYTVYINPFQSFQEFDWTSPRTKAVRKHFNVKKDRKGNDIIGLTKGVRLHEIYIEYLDSFENQEPLLGVTAFYKALGMKCLPVVYNQDTSSFYFMKRTKKVGRKTYDAFVDLIKL